ANFAALLLTAVANTWANRRFTFRIRGPEKAATHQFQGLIVFGIAWVITSGSLVALNVLAPDAPTAVELVTLTAANLVATAVRFVLLRRWVFRAPKDSSPARDSAGLSTDPAAAVRPAPVFAQDGATPESPTSPASSPLPSSPTSSSPQKASAA
ncbi:MAG: hypothetical protein JWR01_2150, partial [Subtercola sp.]|nr:hypothetical protein [Subtercola sp.]